MKQLILLLVLSLSIGVNGQSSSQLTRSTKYPQFIYSTVTANHSIAESVCRQNAYRLVSITSDKIHRQVAHVIGNELDRKAWSAGKIIDGQWRWSNDKVINETSKYWGETKNQKVKGSIKCLILRNPSDIEQAGYWRARGCDESAHYICEDVCTGRCSSGETCSTSDTSPYYTCSTVSNERETTDQPVTTSSTTTTISIPLPSSPTTPATPASSADVCSSSPCARFGTCTQTNVIPFYKCNCALPDFGDNCEKLYCRDENPCLHGSSCRTSGLTPGYRCTCVSGYTGRNCDRDACYNSPCGNSGTCTQSYTEEFTNGGYYQCACSLPYYGYQCREKYCRDDDRCLNGAICNPSGSSPGYTCDCSNGYSGEICDRDACYVTPCNRGGICTHSDSLQSIGQLSYGYYTCSCPDRYTGFRCQYDACTDPNSTPCNTGICTATPDVSPYYSCGCSLPYYGPGCSKKYCVDEKPCLNRAACRSSKSDPGYTCTCNNGYSGTTCENDACYDAPCDHGGTCTHSDSKQRYQRYYTCSCPDRYTGYKCQYDVCHSKPCGDHGSCTTTNIKPYYSCSCQFPYYGETCIKKYCDDMNPCLNRATCRWLYSSPGYRCDCKYGYSGTTCEKNACYNSPCENTGTCRHSDTSQYHGGSLIYYRCTCPNQYYEYKCQYKYCRESNPCKNGGGCTSSTATPGYICSCVEGYTGVTCNNDACSSTPCKNYGTCSLSNVSPYYSCSCRLPYYGRTCTEKYCDDEDPCLNGASCYSISNSPGYRCTCINGYTGNTCNTDGCHYSPCQHGGTCSHSNDKQYIYGSFNVHYTCACPDAYFGYRCQNKYCTSSDSRSSYRCTSDTKGTCSPSTESPGFTCACKWGYFGPTCNKEHCKNSYPCQNGGECTRSTSNPGYQCTCVNGYSGYNCTNDPCSSSPCGVNGQCAVTLEGPNYHNCTCTLPYYGNGTHCNEKHCRESNHCLKGNCVESTKEPGYICQCANGHNGINCEHDACYLNPCQERGKCKVVTESPFSSCSCDLPYFGSNCEKTHCVDTSPCENNGNCSQITEDRGFHCTCNDEYHGENCETKKLNLAGTVGGGIVGLIFALVIIVVIIWAVRKRRSVKPKIEETEMTSVIAATKRQQSSNDDIIVAIRNPASPLEAVVQEMESVYENFNPNIQQDVGVSISISQLLARFENLRKDDFFVLRNEFAQLKNQTNKTDQLGTLASIASRQENAIKNRYKNIVPFDEARVVLSTPENNRHSNYINASYIKLNGKKFIAAQGPKLETIGDFWRMVWQERSKTIVMLTSLEESGKKKCDKYWPDVGEEKVHGDITVLCKNEVRKGNFLKRRISIKRFGKTRAIIQLHYIAWPDHGVPLTTTGLMRLRLELHDTLEDKRVGPIIVHCSAGVGRTGTFIAYVDLVRNEGNDLNVYNTVLEMRKQRVCMVQTADQYIFLYKLITEYHVLEDTDHKIDDFEQVMESINRNENSYQDENEKSVLIRPMSTSVCKLPDNEQHFSLYQHSKIRFYCTPEGKVVHYNGSFVEVYGMDEKVLVVSDPKRNQVERFWLIALSNEVKIIFTIGSSQQRNNSLLPPAVGQSKKMMSNCQLNWVKTERGDQPRMTTNHVTLKQNRNELNIVQVQLDAWPSVDLYSLCRVIDSLEDLLQNSGGTVLVHSRIGEELSGVFLAVWNLYKRMKIEQRFDVLRTIKDLTDMRVGIFNDRGSHEQLYGFIHSYVQNSDANLYANIQLRSVSER